MRSRNVRDLAQPARGLRNHPRCALHERFKHKTSVRVSAFLLGGKLLLDLADAFPVALAIFPRIGALGLRAVERTTVAIGRHHVISLEQQTGVSLMKQSNAAERNGSHSIAVIRTFER